MSHNKKDLSAYGNSPGMRVNTWYINSTRIFPDSQWPALPARSTARVHRLYINEDLTKTRAEVAARARQLKRDGKLDDTWTRDGIIFVKKGDSVHRIATVREIHVFS